MPSSTFYLGRWALVREVEHVEVTSNMLRPDPEWTHTDTNGHLHAYDNGATPTLQWVVDEPGGVYADADGYTDEYPDEGHYECVICAEHVTPGMRAPSMFREFVQGASRCHIEGRTDTDDMWCWVTEEQYGDLCRRLSLTTTNSIRERIIAPVRRDAPRAGALMRDIAVRLRYGMPSSAVVGPPAAAAVVPHHGSSA